MNRTWLLVMSVACACNADKEVDTGPAFTRPGGATDYVAPLDHCAPTTWYEDLDGDGWGVDGTGTEGETCRPPPLSAQAAGDCDDRSSGVNPGAVEVCDGRDNNCDGEIDDDDPMLREPHDWFYDRDSDGYGHDPYPEASCSAPPNTSRLDGDCDDRNSARHPGRSEDTTDGLDNNCDGLVDRIGVVSGSWVVEWGAGPEPGERACVGVYDIRGIFQPDLRPPECPDCDLVFELFETYDEDRSTGTAGACPIPVSGDAIGIALIPSTSGSYTLGTVSYTAGDYYGYYGYYYGEPDSLELVVWEDAYFALEDGILTFEWGARDVPDTSADPTQYTTQWWGFEGTLE